MKSKSQWILIVVVVALLCLMALSNRAQSANKAVWEYKIVETYGPSAMNPPTNLTSFNDLGAEGWELVAIRSGEFPNKQANQIKTEYYFKRMK